MSEAITLPPKMMSVADVADRWSVSSQTVLNIIRRGHLKAIRIGSRYRLQPNDVHNYENNQCHDPSPSRQPTASVSGAENSTPSGGTASRADAFRLGQQIARKQSAH